MFRAWFGVAKLLFKSIIVELFLHYKHFEDYEFIEKFFSFLEVKFNIYGVWNGPCLKSISSSWFQKSLLEVQTFSNLDKYCINGSI
jgi:hypothetical protein